MLVGCGLLARQSAADIQLRIFLSDGDEALRVLRGVAKQFENAHPGVRVKLEAASYDTFFQKLLAEFAAHTAPDVAMLDPQTFQQYAKRGALLPLDELVKSTPGFRIGDYYKESVRAHSYHGTLYVLPRDIAPVGLVYYNKRMFREAGLALPDGTWTWDFTPHPEVGSHDFTYCMQQLTKVAPDGKVIRWGFAPAYAGALTEVFTYTRGARLANDPEDFTQLTYTDPRVVQAFDLVSQIANRRHWMPSQNELTSVVQSTALDLFISQKVAMYLDGIWDVPRIRDAMRPGSPEFFDWDITLSPGYRDPKTGVVNRSQPISGSGYSIMSSTAHPKEAWELVRWMAGPPGMTAMAKAGIAQPAIKRLALGPDWIPGPTTPLEQRYPANRIITDQAIPYGVYQPTADYWAEVSSYVAAKAELVYNGSRAAKGALEEGQREAHVRLRAILRQEHLKPFNWWAGSSVALVGFAALAFWVYWPERGKKRTVRERAEAKAGYAFASPWILGLLLFTVGPMLLSLLMSVTDWDIIQPARARGMENYAEAFTRDARFWNALKVTSIYSVVSVPLGLAVALALALLLNTRVRGMPLFRTCFYLPSLASAVAGSLIWRKIFQSDGGMLNLILFGPHGDWNPLGLRDFLGGGKAPNWLGDERLALSALITMSLWGAGAGMVILLAGLQNVPDTYHEAAQLDGAGPLCRFRVITLPMLSPSIVFCLVTGVIGSFQAFTEAFVMTQGGPNNATRFYMLHLYEQSFGALRMGYAAALAWIMFVIILGVSLVQLRAYRDVYYEGADR